MKPGAISFACSGACHHKKFLHFLGSVRGHSFSLTPPSSIPPSPSLLSLTPTYIIPQQCPHSSLSTSDLWVLHWLSLCFLLFFHLLFWHLHWPLDRLYFIHLWPLYLFLSSPMFIFIFIPISFLMLPGFTFYIQGLSFLFTYSHRLPSSRSLSFSLRISC